MIFHRLFPAMVLAVACLEAQTLSLALSPAQAAANGSVFLELSLKSADAPRPTSALGWTFRFAGLSNIALENGLAAASAGKALLCGGNTPVYVCMVAGPNADIIPNGVVANIRAALDPGSAVAAIEVTDSLGASPEGGAVAVTASGATVGSGADPRFVKPTWRQPGTHKHEP